MKSVCVTKAKAYYIIADGYTECYTFNSREEAESFIELFKPFYKNKTVMIQEANVFTSYIMNDYIIIETYAFDFEVEANNRVEAEEKAKEYVDKYQADKFFECATNRVFKIIPKT